MPNERWSSLEVSGYGWGVPRRVLGGEMLGDLGVSWVDVNEQNPDALRSRGCGIHHNEAQRGIVGGLSRFCTCTKCHLTNDSKMRMVALFLVLSLAPIYSPAQSLTETAIPQETATKATYLVLYRPGPAWLTGNR